MEYKKKLKYLLDLLRGRYNESINHVNVELQPYIESLMVGVNKSQAQ